ncbi:D-alanine--D-alanine ligase [Gammaproteobacteria bacterium]
MKLNIAVIFGGRSVEHEISVLSALQCIAVLDKNKYQVIPVYISKQGQWYTGKKLLDLENYRDLEQLMVQSQKSMVSQNAGSGQICKESVGIFSKRQIATIDVVFPVMHGTHGEDGSLQGLLETMNIPYVGCDVLASAISMDKVTTKMILRSIGISVLDDVWFYAYEWVEAKDAVMSKIKAKFSYPLIVKPGNLGSSVGVTAVNNDSELEDAVDLAVSMSQRILVEPKIINLKEVNCAVLGDHEAAEVSVCEEPVRGDAILSYQDKYLSGAKNKTNAVASEGMSSAKRKIPAEISDEMSIKIQAIAKQAFITLNCNGVVRIDFLIDQSTNEVYLCELNTIPGSLAFYLWKPMGISFTALTEALIGLALKRHRENNNLVVSYNTNILKNFKAFSSKA